METQENSYFFCSIRHVENSPELEMLTDQLRKYASRTSTLIYLLDAPMTMEPQYSYHHAVILLVAKCKICLINMQEDNEDDFEDYKEDFQEDLGHLSQKFEYIQHLGRPRKWKDSLIESTNISRVLDERITISDFLKTIALEDKRQQRRADFLVSLLTGSINDIKRSGGEFPETLLDQVKKKIILFDGDQSRFIYCAPPANQKRVTIQGLAGTGKTELLLHKLKDLYTKEKDSRIVFTCFNKTLARSMESRIPDFFDFMRVDEQIQWKKRLWVMHSWGSGGKPETGLYSYFCWKYRLNFYNARWSFQWVCDMALAELKEKLSKEGELEPCFDYILIDESQDFPQSFFELCEFAAKKTVYIAGDIFQDIYDRTISQSIKSDFLLNKCYRTDPKNLMFAHAVGMGLYERPVIRWLENQEWELCGYSISQENGVFSLSRSPLRRFEDLEMSGIPSIVLEGAGSEWRSIGKRVLEIIAQIRQQHNTVKPEDIAVVFLGTDNENYLFADWLAASIKTYFQWDAVKGYESKDNSQSAVFVSNRNNIKGLEFPFVICVALGEIIKNIRFRNVVYMTLTRSFITSYFLVNSELNREFLNLYQDAVSRILRNNRMDLRKPNRKELETIERQITIDMPRPSRPVRDIVVQRLVERNVPEKYRGDIIDSMIRLVQKTGINTEDAIQQSTDAIIQAYAGVWRYDEE